MSSSSISGCQSTPEREALGGILDRLERSVLGVRALDETLADPADALMVARAHRLVPRPEDRLEPCPFLDVDRVLREDTERLAVPFVPDLLREVLDEVAAAQDVQQLEAAADRERRQVALERRLEETQLAGIAVGLRRIGRRVTVGTVVRRIDVDAAREDDARRERRASPRSPSSLGGTTSARPPACSTDST